MRGDPLATDQSQLTSHRYLAFYHLAPRTLPPPTEPRDGHVLKTGTNPYSWPYPTHEAGTDPNWTMTRTFLNTCNNGHSLSSCIVWALSGIERRIFRLGWALDSDCRTPKDIRCCCCWYLLTASSRQVSAPVVTSQCIILQHVDWNHRGIDRTYSRIQNCSCNNSGTVTVFTSV